MPSRSKWPSALLTVAGVKPVFSTTSLRGQWDVPSASGEFAAQMPLPGLDRLSYCGL